MFLPRPTSALSSPLGRPSFPHSRTVGAVPPVLPHTCSATHYLPFSLAGPTDLASTPPEAPRKPRALAVFRHESPRTYEWTVHKLAVALLCGILLENPPSATTHPSQRPRLCPPSVANCVLDIFASTIFLDNSPPAIVSDAYLLIHFATHPSCKRYLDLKMATNPYCEHCGTLFSQEREFRVHNRSFHIAQPPKWECRWEGCSYISKQKPSLDDHVNEKHTRAKPHQCPDCPATFSARAKRSVHRKECHGHFIKHSEGYEAKISLLESLGKAPAARKAKRTRRRCEPYPSRSPAPPQASGSHDADWPQPEMSTVEFVDPPDLTGRKHWCRVTPSFANESATGSCFQIDFTDIARGVSPGREPSVVPDFSSSSSSSTTSHFSFAPSMPESATTTSTGTLYEASSPVWQPPSPAPFTQQPVQQTDMWAGIAYPASAEQYAAPYTPPAPQPLELQLDVAYGANTSANYLQDGFVDTYPGYFDITGLETQQLMGYSSVDVPVQSAANEMPANFGYGMAALPQRQVYEAPAQGASLYADSFNFPPAMLGSSYGVPPWQLPLLEDVDDEYLNFEQNDLQVPVPVVPAQPGVAAGDEYLNFFLSFDSRYPPQS
ncbi:hypothetical protein EVG20_g4781 [Dentipellis fragilis]|uniref:C2H2-type domain-containing protein n=1 Tax=Dentipellis fragilis TaxID=205917 RepID=A0A4Y9YVR1_9AGAM|nr:hypothetical protein EVG20_g4781 [Dentipellis fragilis]